MFVQLHLSPVSKPQESQTETNILSEKVKKTCTNLIGPELNFNRFNSKSRRAMSVHKVSNSNECCLNLPRLSKLIDVIIERFDYISQVLRIRTTENKSVQIATKQEEERHRKYKERYKCRRNGN